MGPSVAAVVVAAGRGLRAGGDLPKQYRDLAGEPVIRSSLSLFVLAWPDRRGAGGHPSATTAAPTRPPPRACGCLPPVLGGATRQASVRAGLEALERTRARHRAGPRRGAAVLLGRACLARHRRLRRNRRRDPGAGGHRHDQARRCGRPCRRHRRSRAAARGADAAGVRVRRAARGAPPRGARRAATISPTTPRWPNGPGIKVATFAGEAGNMKLTTDEDFAKAEARRIASLADMRIGNGFDVHAFGDGDHVRLGGVKIPHDRGLDRPFRRRRRAACAGRRDPRRAGRRRHRRAFPAERSAMARRVVRSVPDIRGRARHQARRHASRISISPSSARRRASARIATPCASASPRSPGCRSIAWR